MTIVPPRHSRPVDPCVAAIAADIAVRLRGACAHLGEAEFSALVQELVDTKLRWAARYGEVPVVGPVGPVGDERTA